MITPGFYTPQTFVAKLNNLMGPRVSLVNDKLVWSLVGVQYTLTGGSISDVIGLRKPMGGTFETQLTLSSPAAVALRCKQIQSYVEPVNCHKNPIGAAPLLVFNLVRGYGNLEVYEPQTPYQETFSMHATDTLSFELIDPRTGRILDEVAAWSMVIRTVSA